MRVPGGGNCAKGTPDSRASMSLAAACTAAHLASSVCRGQDMQVHKVKIALDQELAVPRKKPGIFKSRSRGTARLSHTGGIVGNVHR